MIERIQSLARKFTELTGNPVPQPLTYSCQGEAREFLNAGFTEDDLALMVKFRIATVKEPIIRRNMLRWRFIIGDVQRFAEDLLEAKAHFQKKRPKTDREKVLACTGREENHSVGSNKMVGQVLSEAGAKAFEAFKLFRQELEKP